MTKPIKNSKDFGMGTTRKHSLIAAMLACVLDAGLLLVAPTPVSAQELDRTGFPIPEPKLPPITEIDARNVKPPPRFEVRAPKGAPNVVIVLLDDFGLGQSRPRSAVRAAKRDS